MILGKEPHYSKIPLAIDIDASHLNSEKQGSSVVLLIVQITFITIFALK